jgi:hypothetical protein
MAIKGRIRVSGQSDVQMQMALPLAVFITPQEGRWLIGIFLGVFAAEALIALLGISKIIDVDEGFLKVLFRVVLVQVAVGVVGLFTVFTKSPPESPLTGTLWEIDIIPHVATNPAPGTGYPPELILYVVYLKNGRLVELDSLPYPTSSNFQTAMWGAVQGFINSPNDASWVLDGTALTLKGKFGFTLTATIGSDPALDRMSGAAEGDFPGSNPNVTYTWAAHKLR